MGTLIRTFLHIALCGMCFYGIPGAASFAMAQRSSDASELVAELPDSPGAALLKSQEISVQQSSARQPAGAPISNQSLAMQSQPIVPQDQEVQSSQSRPRPAQGSQQSDQKPVGTAAAGSIPVTGIAASQPAGVAIAPAKQHRVRTVVLRVGAILGAVVAVGSVVALTEATPSKPPGAR
jgi:hypothetical protein